jgi:hypothetical protein
MKSRLRHSLIEGLGPRRFQRARFAAFLVVPILVACNDTTGPARFVVITPASESVALQTVPGGKMLNTWVTLTNISSKPIGFNACRGVSLERRVDISANAALADGPKPPWTQVWTAPCGFEALAAVIGTGPLQPGATMIIPVNVLAGVIGAAGFDGSPGLYRVHLTLATEILGVSGVIPHDLSVSNPFSLTGQ